MHRAPAVRVIAVAFQLHDQDVLAAAVDGAARLEHDVAVLTGRILVLADLQAAREQVVPRVKSTYETRFKPSVDRSLLLATGARSKVLGEVLPALTGVAGSPGPRVVASSVLAGVDGNFDAIVTDPPYYDAIAYADLSLHRVRFVDDHYT